MSKRDFMQDAARGLSVFAMMAGLALVPAAPAAAQERMTAQSVIDRAQIEDLLTRYYNNFGNPAAQPFSDFYADDAELVLGPNSYKGKEGIENAYKQAGRPQGQNAAPNPRASAYAFTVTIGNPIIVVHGQTATAQLVFTEFLTAKQGEPPQVLVQGREYDHLVKAKGQWRLKKRQIVGDNKPPAGWPN